MKFFAKGKVFFFSLGVVFRGNKAKSSFGKSFCVETERDFWVGDMKFEGNR
jgi:hypothetical protein